MGPRTFSLLGTVHQVNPNQITKWKRRLLEDGT